MRKPPPFCGKRAGVLLRRRWDRRGLGQGTAEKVRVQIVGQKAGLKAAGGAHGPAGQAQVLRHHKPDALDQHIPALGCTVGGDGQGFHAPGLFPALLVQLGEDGGQGHPLSRADPLQGHVQLENAALGGQVHLAQVHLQGVLASLHRQGHGLGTGLGVDHNVAVHRHRGLGEGDQVALPVLVGDGLIHRHGAGLLAHMADEKVQGGALPGGHPQLRDVPPQGAGVQHGGRPLGGG